MRRFVFILMFFAPIAMGAERRVIEISPLRSVLGYTATRVELFALPDLSIGSSYDEMRNLGNREGKWDEVRRFGVEATFYPDNEVGEGLMVGAGLGFREALLGYQQERSYRSDTQYTADNRYDSWALLEKSIIVPAFVGFRISFGSFLTASVRYVFENEIFSSGSIVERDIKSYGFSPKAESGKIVNQYVTVYTGVEL